MKTDLRDDLANLVDQVIHEMEGTGDTSSEGNRCWSIDLPHFQCQSARIFLMYRDVEPPCHVTDPL